MTVFRKKQPFERVKAKWVSRIAHVGLSFEDLSHFMNLFVDSKFLGYGRRNFDGDWVRIYNRKTRQPVPATWTEICNHLGERYWIGVTNHQCTTRIAIDVDTHTLSTTAATDRVQMILNALPFFLPFRSSTSGGVHLYCWSIMPRPVGYLKQRLGATLRRIGLTQLPAKNRDIEILPTENCILRLPLGKDSYLLNEALQPLDIPKSEAIHRIRIHHCDNCDAAESYFRGREPDSKKIFIVEKSFEPRIRMDEKPGNRRPKKPAKQGLNKYNQMDPEAILSGGIREPGTRHSLTLYVATMLRKSGLSKIKAHIRLHQWVGYPFHKSTTIQRNRGEAVIDMVKILDWTYENVQVDTTPLTSNVLTTGDIRQFLTMVSEDSDSIGREQLKRLGFLFNVIGMYKAKGVLELPLAKAFLLSLPHITARTYLPCLTWAIDKGILIQSRAANWKKHHAKCFCLNYQFQPGDPVSCLERGILTVLGPDGVCKHFTRRIAVKLLSPSPEDAQT